jgi:hypothetical protein
LKEMVDEIQLTEEIDIVKWNIGMSKNSEWKICICSSEQRGVALEILLEDQDLYET